ncbi:MAG: hypothetical protein SF053_05675 [Bacteroidia bacterium]|nr:hypothetical protein [Bacteroidia bacterium]
MNRILWFGISWIILCPAGLAQDQLWGTTHPYNNNLEGGTVFRVAADGTGFQTVYQFPNGIGGTWHPSYFVGSDDKLYGFTTGYLGLGGAVIRMNLDGSHPEKLLGFVPADAHIGLFPTDILEGSDGRLYIAVTGNTEGSFSGGSIFSINRDGTDRQLLYSYQLQSTDPLPVKFGFTRLLEGPDGWLYGIGSQITQQGFPVLLESYIFRIQKNGSGFTYLKTFPPGTAPTWLIAGPDGTLYGVLDSLEDVVFRMQPDGSAYTVIHTFTATLDPTDPENPLPTLILHSNNRLYGMTFNGGTANYGTLYSLSTTGGIVLEHGFANASLGTGRLRSESDGSVYGISQADIVDFSGFVFRFQPGGGYQQLYLYSYAQRAVTGRNPTGAPFLYQGQLYGIATTEGPDRNGVLFRINPATGTYDPYYALSGVPVGANPQGALLRHDDKWFGVNLSGTYSASGAGVSPGCVFSMAADGTSARTVYSLDYPEGLFPSGGIVSDAQDYLYGVASSDGGAGYGTIFRVKTDGTGAQTLHTFSLTDGAYPSHRLTWGPGNQLFGVTSRGGTADQGIIFRIGADGTGFMVLHAFTGPDGTYPSGALTYAPDGLLYGVTESGGSTSAGTIFRINPDGTGFQVLYDLSSLAGASQPQGALYVHTDGRLIGALTYGEAVGSCGAIFSIQADGQQFTILREFVSTDFSLCRPTGSLKAGSDGFLYGMAAAGSDPLTTSGGVYKISPDGQTLSVVHAFDYLTGYYGDEITVVENPLAIAQASLPADLDIRLANPMSQAAAQVTLTSQTVRPLTLSLHDGTGRVIWTTTPAPLIPGVPVALTLPVAHLPDGLYLLTFADKKAGSIATNS